MFFFFFFFFQDTQTIPFIEFLIHVDKVQMMYDSTPL